MADRLVYGNDMFDQRVTEEAARAERALEGFSLLALDADQVLEGPLLTALDGTLRIYDTIGYLNRTPMVILPRVETMDAIVVAHRLIKEAAVIGITLTIGTASFPARVGSSQEIKRAAEKALGYARGAALPVFAYERELDGILDHGMPRFDWSGKGDPR